MISKNKTLLMAVCVLVFHNQVCFLRSRNQVKDYVNVGGVSIRSVS